MLNLAMVGWFASIIYFAMKKSQEIDMLNLANVKTMLVLNAASASVSIINLIAIWGLGNVILAIVIMFSRHR
jgi:hypothetical protein